MSNVKQYIENLCSEYSDTACVTESNYDKKLLATVPECLREFYRHYTTAQLPFGRIDSIENAVSHSKREPFRSEGWFCFGSDGYFSFWLCRFTPEEDGLSFTSWDHDSGCEIDSAVYATFVDFLEAMREECYDTSAL